MAFFDAGINGQLIMETSETIGNISRIRFKSRVDDWLTRINLLYEQIEVWIKDYKEFDCLKDRQIIMHEELMKSHHTPAKNIDILDVYMKEIIILSFVPFGLWVIGSNGRLDVVAKNNTWLLIDKSLPLKSPQEWTLISRSIKNIETEFNQDTFRNLLQFVQ